SVDPKGKSSRTSATTTAVVGTTDSGSTRPNPDPRKAQSRLRTIPACAAMVEHEATEKANVAQSRSGSNRTTLALAMASLASRAGRARTYEIIPNTTGVPEYPRKTRIRPLEVPRVTPSPSRASFSCADPRKKTAVIQATAG